MRKDKTIIICSVVLMLFNLLILAGCTETHVSDNSPTKTIEDSEVKTSSANKTPSGPKTTFNHEIDIEQLLSDKTKAVNLKITETVEDIKTKDDAFYVSMDTGVTVIDEDGVKQWQIGRQLERDEYFVIIRDPNERVFVTKDSDGEGKKYDNCEITNFLIEKGINIPAMTVDKPDMDSISGTFEYLVFRISDGDGSIFFYMKWDDADKIKAIPLGKYDIIDTAFHYSGDEAYLIRNNDCYSIIFWNLGLKEAGRYDISKDIGEIEEFYSGYLDSKLYMKVYDTKANSTYIYEIDTSKKTMKKYLKVADWRREYGLKLRFASNLPYNYILGCVDNILLAYAHDGGYSGTHSHKYLYGIDMSSGEKLWSVYGGYAEMYWSISESKESIYVVKRVYDSNHPGLLNINIHTGEILWEKEYDVKCSINIAAVKEGVAVQKTYKKDNFTEVSSVEVLNGENGSLIWEMDLDQGTYMETSEGSTNNVITYYSDGVKCYDAKNGGLIWSLNASLEKKSDVVISPFSWIVENPANPYEQPAPKSMWAAFEDGFRLIDLDSGSILRSVERNPDSYMFLLNDEYALIKNVNESGYCTSYAKSFTLYSLKDGKKLWSKEDSLLYGVTDNERLYYISKSKIICVDIHTGNINWEREFQLENARVPVITDEELLVANGNISYPSGGLFSFNKFNGELNYQEVNYAPKTIYWTTGRFDWPIVCKSGSSMIVAGDNGNLDLLELKQP